MDVLHQYARALRDLAGEAADGVTADERERRIVSALDGQMNLVLRRALTLKERQVRGAFFTSSALAQQLVEPVASRIEEGQVVLDPACGAGDLLLASTRYLPIGATLLETLALWGERIAGVDICPEFVHLAKLRLLLAAGQRHGKVGDEPLPDVDSLFPRICVGDGKAAMADWQNEITLVMNPPFPQVVAPSGNKWCSGLVSEAALFLASCCEVGGRGTRVAAILPDVLRTGSRYDKWRRHIASLAKIESLSIFGKFGPGVGVDVFRLYLTLRGQTEIGQESRWYDIEPLPKTATIESKFEVWVGPVVKLRDPHKGKFHPFLLSGLVKPGAKLDTDMVTCRRYGGRTFRPPFIAVRRTSSPRDQIRIVAALVTGSKPVAVENHLLVCMPRDGKFSSCETLLAQFAGNEAKKWLNQRIRCRHLTVGALREMPWMAPGQ